jgi:hypothetical protein
LYRKRQGYLLNFDSNDPGESWSFKTERGSKEIFSMNFNKKAPGISGSLFDLLAPASSRFGRSWEHSITKPAEISEKIMPTISSQFLDLPDSLAVNLKVPSTAT